jgi:hypothetical protein
MPKLNRYQRTELKNLVISAMIRRLSIAETQQLIRLDLHVDISEDYISHFRMQLKHDSARELQLLQKDRDYYLKCTFWDRLAS